MSCFQRFIGLLSPFRFRFKAPLQIHRSHPCSDPPGLSVPASVETAHGRSQIPVLCPGEWGPPACSCLAGQSLPVLTCRCTLSSLGLTECHVLLLPFHSSCLVMPFPSTQRFLRVKSSTGNGRVAKRSLHRGKGSKLKKKYNNTFLKEYKAHYFVFKRHGDEVTSKVPPGEPRKLSFHRRNRLVGARRRQLFCHSSHG